MPVTSEAGTRITGLSQPAVTGVDRLRTTRRPTARDSRRRPAISATRACQAGSAQGWLARSTPRSQPSPNSTRRAASALPASQAAASHNGQSVAAALDAGAAKGAGRARQASATSVAPMPTPASSAAPSSA
ncbi:Uncharacterised protein [Achromobacter xylosoxidans]|nr:Uncharacterised protein [Achromobacter xylosoxidans]